MDDQDNKSGLDNGSNTGSIGQFSFAPATRTTVVTTTTTTTTTFPPLFIKPPRATRELDPKLYPLASSPTPSLLRNIKFEIGDQTVVFNEPEDTAGAVNELREKEDVLRASSGLVRSVTSICSDDTQLPRRFAGPRAFRVESQESLRALSVRREQSQSRTVVPERSKRTVHPEDESKPTLPQEVGTDEGPEDESGTSTSQDTGYETSQEAPQQDSLESTSQSPNVGGVAVQDMCLPSPSLSPVAAMNAMNVDSSFESAEEPEADTDSSLDNNDHRLVSSLRTEDARAHASYRSRPNSLPASSNTPRPTSLMDIPSVLDFFDSVPEGLKTYLMYQLLRRCPKPTLHFVADVVNPALKCDFLALLPLELSLNIVKYFDVQTMCRAAQVSKKWRHIINSDEKSWKELFDRDGYVLPEGELERAIKEGWGWQFPNGGEDYEKDLSLSSLIKPDPGSASPSMQPLSGPSDRPSSAHRRPKRKACTRVSSRKLAKRKISSSGTDNSESSDWRKSVTAAEGPYAAANAAAAAVPYPEHGMPTLRGLHLYKSLYQRHHSIHKGWMKPNVKPRHIAFRAHDRHVVTCLQFDTDKVLTGSDDTNINVYDTKTGALRATLEGHEGGVWALEYYGNTLVSGSTDRPGDPVYYQNGPHVDDTDCPYFVRVLTGHQHSVRTIAAHGDTLVSGSYDCTVRVWKISTGEALHRLQGHSLKVYSVVLDHKRNRCISGSMDNMVKVWSLETGSILYNLEGHSSLVGLLDLNCDRLVSAAADSTLRIWDPETGQCKNMLSAHTGAITCFQHDGQKVISGSDRTLKMWDVRTGECVRDLLTDLSGVWQVKFNDRRCVAAVQRDSLTYIEVLDFGASRDGIPEDQLGRRIVVNRWGQEVSESDEDYDLSDA
ncbi:SCF ubiquitin ligase complex subunit cdc4 [Aspergillus hancockii]|nr:SCF ubiquitin ligase complex subunit cdc4 [Aspergillus hancockii]